METRRLEMMKMCLFFLFCKRPYHLPAIKQIRFSVQDCILTSFLYVGVNFEVYTKVENLYSKI